MPSLSELEQALARHSPRGFARRSWLSWAAVALILREGPTGVELLFVERARRRGDRWSGHLAFPGGLEQQGDSDIAATAIRETLEEAGFDLGKSARRLGALGQIVTARHGGLAPLVVAPVVFALNAPVEIALGDELAHSHWADLDGLCRERRRRSRLGRARGWLSRAHGEPIGQQVCWGLSLMFVDELCRVANKSDFSLDR